MGVQPTEQTMQSKAEAGFTLTEVMMIVGIISLLTVIAIPNFLDWNRKYKLKDSVATLHGYVGLARMNAINQNSNVTVTVTQASSTSPVTVTFLTSSNAPVLPTYTMSTEVSLSNATGGTVGAGVSSPQSVTFSPMGLKVDTGSGNNLCVDHLTGAPKACSSSETQVFNFRNSTGLNYRLLITSTGKATWCYTSNCTF